MRFLIFILACVLFVGIAEAETTRYAYKVLRVVDGDTVEIEAAYLPKELRNTLYLRIIGVDTPEKGARAKCIREAMGALKAKFFIEQEIKKATKVEITLSKWDKYGGRVLGDILLDDVPVSKKLIDSRLAKPYNGGKKSGWCTNE